MTRAVLGLGGNLGDARGALRSAVAALAASPGVEVVAVSGLWRTAAVGGPAQPDYLNAVVLVETSLEPVELLAVAHATEQLGHRERGVRWGPRTVDVDVLAVDQVRSDDPHLSLPHPRAHQRAFALLPWAQVAPDWILAPLSGEQPRPVSSWAAAVADQRAVLVEEGAWWR